MSISFYDNNENNIFFITSFMSEYVLYGDNNDISIYLKIIIKIIFSLLRLSNPRVVEGEK